MMSRWTEILGYGHGGIVVAALAIGGVMAARRMPPSRQLPAAVYMMAGLALIPVLCELLLSTWYLFSPTYIDHIEASAASVAQYFLQGVPVYPRLDSYTFHGLVYGPLLAETNSLGYRFASGVLASKLVGWAAAWIAIAVVLLTEKRRNRNWAWMAASACALCVLTSFGPILTANRADSLLLLCAAVALFGVLRLPRLSGLALAALLAGAAADLKLHGPVYVAPALCLWASRQGVLRPRSWLAAALLAIGAGMIGILLPFIPANVTWPGYLSYLQLAARHGLSWSAFGGNCAFLLSLWVPVLLALSTAPPANGDAHRSGFARLANPFTLALLTAELLVAVIASKPGAGAHHLLPFLGFHAFLLQRLLTPSTNQSAADSRFAPTALVCIAVVILGTAWPAAGQLRNFLAFDLQLSEQEITAAELARLAARYPQGMMGIAGPESYRLTIFRPWLTAAGTRQTDYGAWMDWRLSGVSDAPLAGAFERCEIPYLFMPKGGEPFTMRSGYGGLLFSDSVRTSFALRYLLVESGRYFNVFACHA